MLDTPQEEENAFLRMAGAQTLEKNEQYITEHFSLIYEEITNSINSMLKYINGTATRLGGEAHSIQLLMVVFALVVSVCLVAFAVQYQRLVERKIQDQETYYRDFLFRVLSENIDTGVYDL